MPHYDWIGSRGQITWTRAFVGWYNHEHHHSGLGLLPPTVVHHGQVEAVRTKRQAVLAAAQAAHPERFVRGTPRVPEVPTAVWINPPQHMAEHLPDGSCTNQVVNDLP